MRIRTVVFALLIAAPLWAEETPSIGRGLDMAKLYQFGEIDAVDLQTGALSVTIPIGNPYPVSEKLSYQFSATHTSRAWDYVRTGESYSAFPHRRSNAGIGWSLHFGQLIHPSDPFNPPGTTLWKYIAPDLGEHEFYASLHSGEPESATVGYTRDSSYLRLKHLDGVSGPTKEVEFPDGTIRKFVRRGSASSVDFRLMEIRDRIEEGGAPKNWMRIAYSADDLTWTVSDSQVRTPHEIKFVNVPYGGGFRKTVDYVKLAVSGGAVAQWNFTYLNDGGSSPVWRSCWENGQAQINVPVLAAITPPEGRSWQFTNWDQDPQPEWNPPDPEPGNYFCKQSVLDTVTLPTGGQIQYDYTTFELPANDPCPDNAPSDAPVEIPVLAIATRSFVDPVVKNPSVEPAVWEYAYTPSTTGVGRICQWQQDGVLPPEWLQVTVQTPAKDKTEYFFSVWPAFTESPNFFNKADYGLPFKRSVAEGGRFLSSITYDCDASGTVCDALRSQYVLYEQDLGGKRANRRVQAQRTVYHDDNGVYGDVAYSNFDGVGHYRQATLSGTFDTGNDHTTFTNFNPGRGTYPSSYIPLPASERWILGTYSTIDTTGGVPVNTARKTFDFDATTGLVKSVRTHKNEQAEGVNDLFTLFCRDSEGNVTSELFYGGDGSLKQIPDPLPDCDAGPPASDWQYRLDHTYASGVRETSKYNGSSFFIHDITVDSNTGLASSARDSAGVETTFTYDLLGRLTKAVPQQFGTLQRDASTSYKYWEGTASAPAAVEVWRCPPGTPSCTVASSLASEYVEVDGFGRPWHEVRRMPDTSDKAVRVSRYDSMGRKERVSSWVYDADVAFPDETALAASVFGEYDPFGRPGSVAQADGTETIYFYLGDQWVSTDQMVARALSGTESCVRRWDRYDRQGRLDRVEEAYESCTGGGPTSATNYEFDEAGRLTKVCQNMSGGICQQERFFSYDDRGFLLSEQHPEKGASGNGTVTHSCYDAKGHARFLDDGAAAGRRLSFEFDVAERLLRVRAPLASETCDTAEPTGIVWKELSYADSNTGNEASLGKLRSAYRRNDLAAPGSLPSLMPVTETYSYLGRQGRVSQRLTETTGLANERWKLEQTYDPLGVIATLNYPAICRAPACGNGWFAYPRSATMTYEKSLLETITATDAGDLVSDVSYHPSGMTHQVTHGNGTREIVARASHGMARPHAIEVRNGSGVVLWKTGTYAYDGTGNIKSMTKGLQVDRYQYDAFSRLITAQLGTMSVPNQSYGFDNYGNLISVTTGGSTVPFPVQAETNRLSGANYDAGGNLTSWHFNQYTFDLLGQMRYVWTGEEGRGFAYTADGERLYASLLGGAGLNAIWTLRDLDGRLLTRVSIDVGIAGTEAKQTDYFYRPEGLVASADSVYQDGPPSEAQSREQTFGATDVRHFGLDHLGTIRLITGAMGAIQAQHSYYPFGSEATSTSQDAEVMKFTGHERDLFLSTSKTEDDLDYMHARFRSPLTGRFLSVDPVLGTPEAPQSWNRYTYVQGNPLRFVDPDGKRLALAANTDEKGIRRVLTALLTRPTSRGMLQKLATAEAFTVTWGTKSITSRAKVAMDEKNGKATPITFALTTPLGSHKTGSWVASGANVNLDLAMVAARHPDKSGTTTGAHELSHVMTLFGGASLREVQAGDVPTPETGPAAQAGKAMAAETPDMSEESATRLLDQLLQGD